MKTVFRILLSLGIVFSCGAQVDTTGGRYTNALFDSVKTTFDVPYANGLNALGQVQDLKLDVYEPFGDTVSKRPAIVFVHGGSFIQGSKAELAPYCTRFAQRGYVVVAIQYRLGFSSFTPPAVVQAVIRATQDFKNAIRFLRRSSTNGNPYHIHENLIFGAGVSAGAITTLHAAYMDQLAELPVGQFIPSLDSLHNTGQIPGYDWKFKAAINIAGGLGDTAWMNSADIPVASFHGTADAVVPYQMGTFGGALTLYGSQPVSLRAGHLGVYSTLRLFPGGAHDYTIDHPEWRDTTENRICSFLLPLLQPVTTQFEQHLVKNSKPMIFKIEAGWQIEQCQAFSSYGLYNLQGQLLKTGPCPGKSVAIPEQTGTVLLRLTGENTQPQTYVLPGNLLRGM